MRRNVPSHRPLSHVKFLPLEERILHVPPFLKRFVEHARSSFQAKSVTVFGSRARGDETELSDWDLAFEIPSDKKEMWARFVVELPETAESLLEIDAVDVDEAPEALKEAIVREGIRIA